MRGIRVLRNVVTNYLRLILTAGVALVLTPLMVRGLGDRDYGLRDFIVLDPDGFGVRFAAPIEG